METMCIAMEPHKYIKWAEEILLVASIQSRTLMYDIGLAGQDPCPVDSRTLV
jgi:hypothetical protein